MPDRRLQISAGAAARFRYVCGGAAARVRCAAGLRQGSYICAAVEQEGRGGAVEAADVAARRNGACLLCRV